MAEFGEIIEFPAFTPEKISDTTGAGDIFATAFSYIRASKEDITRAAAVANALAAISLTKPKNKLDFSLEEVKELVDR